MRREKELFHTVEWNKETGEERELVVTYTYYAGTHRIIHSRSLEPNDSPEIEILSAKVNMPTPNNQNNMEDVLDNLSEKDLEKIRERIQEVEIDDYNNYE